MTNEIYAKLESNVRSYCRDIPNQFLKAESSFLYDDHRTAYLDFLSGSGALNYGHGAIILDIIQGEGGMNVAGRKWAARLQDIARKNDLLLIVDKIQSGCGRSSDFFAFEALGIEPDIIALAKSISGFGLPLSLLLITPEIDLWFPAEHSGTFRGNSHAFITGKVTMDKYWSDDSFSKRIDIVVDRVDQILNRINEDTGFAVKGRGLMRGINAGTSEAASIVKKECYSKRLIVETCGPNGEIIKLLPPLTISDEELELGFEKIQTALKKVQSLRKV